MVNIGIIGCGRLGTSLAKGWIRKGRHVVHCYDVSAERLAEAEKLGAACHSSLQSLLSRSEAVVLAVKPTSIADVAEAGGPGFQGKLLVSPAALVKLEELQRLFEGACVVKCMLNIAAEVGESTVLYCLSPNCSASAAELFVQLFSELGTCMQVEEPLVDLATFIVGCGPAYIAYLAGAIAEAGVDIGLPEELSAKLTLQTIKGTIALLQQHPPEEVISRVATPGGLTERILANLERSRLKELLKRAITEAHSSLRR